MTGEMESETRANGSRFEINGLELSDLIDAGLTLLALLFAALLVVEFTADLSPRQSRWVSLVGIVIWAIFTVDFVVRLALARSKTAYLRSNWLAGLAVLLPAFRVARILRAFRVLRLMRLGRVVTTGNRSIRATRRISDETLIYVSLLGLIALFLSAAGVYALEQDAPDTGIDSFGEAVWWAAATLTTIGSGFEPVTLEGRLLAVLVMVVGLGLSGYITARVAVLLLGRERVSGEAALMAEVRALREEVARLRETLDEGNRRASG